MLSLIKNMTCLLEVSTRYIYITNTPDIASRQTWLSTTGVSVKERKNVAAITVNYYIPTYLFACTLI